MATNPMLWVGYPRSYTAGRARAVQFVTLHYTAGSEGPTSAESGAQYDKNRTDGTSCHAFFDSQGPGLQEVPFGDRSHSALFRGNEIGVHFEICGTIQTREQWLDPTSLATLKTCAAAVAYTCDALGLAKRRLSVAETRAAYFNPVGSRPTGINDHAAITQAFPEDGGDHMDVGTAFPWDVFMNMVGGNAPQPVKKRRSNMPHIIIQPNDKSGIAIAWPSDRAKGWVYTNIIPPGSTSQRPEFPAEVVAQYLAAGAIDGRGWNIPNFNGYIPLEEVPGESVTVGDITVDVGNLDFNGKITPAGK